MVVGGYTLHLYCDARACLRSWEHANNPQTFNEAAKLARVAGWTIVSENGNKETYCPEHSRERRLAGWRAK
jgi:hypothetical protein